MSRIVVVVLLLLAVERGAEAGEKCVSIRKKTKVYAQASTTAPVGAATGKAVGFVEEKQGAWLKVRFERVAEHPDGEYSRELQVTAFVRKRDTKKARCPPDATIAMMRRVGDGMDLHWPDGTRAGWWSGNIRRKALLASTDEISVDAKSLRCVDFTELAGLKLQVCADPEDVDSGDLDAQIEDIADEP